MHLWVSGTWKHVIKDSCEAGCFQAWKQPWTESLLWCPTQWSFLLFQGGTLWERVMKWDSRVYRCLVWLAWSSFLPHYYCHTLLFDGTLFFSCFCVQWRFELKPFGLLGALHMVLSRRWSHIWVIEVPLDLKKDLLTLIPGSVDKCDTTLQPRPGSDFLWVFSGSFQASFSYSHP